MMISRKSVQTVKRLTLAACLLLPWAGQAAPFSSLEEQMTQAEFEAAGLNRLSPEELARLNAWIAARMPEGRLPAEAVTTVPGTEDRRGFKEPVDDRPIVSTIPGQFTGWRGNTRFELANGQVWEQVGGGVFKVKLDNPEVTIEPAMFGSWRLKVKGYNATTKVRRIR